MAIVDIDQAGREALSFGVSIAVYGSVRLLPALMLVGIPLLVVVVVVWVVLAHRRPPGSAGVRSTGIR